MCCTTVCGRSLRVLSLKSWAGYVTVGGVFSGADAATSAGEAGKIAKAMGSSGISMVVSG